MVFICHSVTPPSLFVWSCLTRPASGDVKKFICFIRSGRPATEMPPGIPGLRLCCAQIGAKALRVGTAKFIHL